MEDENTFIYQFVYYFGEVNLQNRGFITRELPFLSGTYDITFLQVSATCQGSTEQQTLYMESRELNFPAILTWTSVLSATTVQLRTLQFFSRLTEYSANSQKVYNSLAPLTDDYDKNGGFTLKNQHLTGQLGFRFSNSGANAGATSGTAFSFASLFNMGATNGFIITLKFKKIL